MSSDALETTRNTEEARGPSQGIHLSAAIAGTMHLNTPVERLSGRRTILAVVVAVLVVLIATLLVFVHVSTTSQSFAFSNGSHLHEPMTWSRRECFGVSHRPESYDGWTTYCIGVPYGDWKCFVSYADGGPTFRVPCR